MPMPIHVYRELEGACYDALKMLHDNNTRGAFNLLAEKLLRIKRYEKESSYKLIWDYRMEERNGVQNVSSEMGSEEEVQSEGYPRIVPEVSGDWRTGSE